MVDAFRRFANAASRALGTPLAFALAVGVVLAWAVTGPLFHYSDSWADPGKQTKPAAWAAYDFPTLTTTVHSYTRAVLDTLKLSGVVPSWVQIGNETNDGMLWPDGHTWNPPNWDNLAEFLKYYSPKDGWRSNAEAVLVALALGIESRDPYTGNHCERLARYAADLGHHIGLDGDSISALKRGGSGNLRALRPAFPLCPSRSTMSALPPLRSRAPSPIPRAPSRKRSRRSPVRRCFSSSRTISSPRRSRNAVPW
jgi:hypothetical protein